MGILPYQVVFSPSVGAIEGADILSRLYSMDNPLYITSDKVLRSDQQQKNMGRRVNIAAINDDIVKSLDGEIFIELPNMESGEGVCGLIQKSLEYDLFKSFTTKSLYETQHINEISHEIFKHYRPDLPYEDFLTALQEALSNAIIHGNLGVETPVNISAASLKAYAEAIQGKLADDLYAYKRVHIAAKKAQGRLIITIEDEGDGFDAASVEQQEKGAFGNGLRVIRALAKEMHHDEAGRRVNMSFALQSDDGQSVIAPDDAHIIRILVSQASQRDFLRNVLEQEENVIVLDGTNSDSVEHYNDKAPVDLVLADMDTIWILKSATVKAVPLILFGNDNSDDMRKQAFDAGADDVLDSPLEANEVLARVRIHLGRYQKVRALWDYRDKMLNDIKMAFDTLESLIPNKVDRAQFEAKAGVRLELGFENLSNAENCCFLYGFGESKEGRPFLFFLYLDNSALSNLLKMIGLHAKLVSAKDILFKDLEKWGDSAVFFQDESGAFRNFAYGRLSFDGQASSRVLHLQKENEKQHIVTFHVP